MLCHGKPFLHLLRKEEGRIPVPIASIKLRCRPEKGNKNAVWITKKKKKPTSGFVGFRVFGQVLCFVVKVPGGNISSHANVAFRNRI